MTVISKNLIALAAVLLIATTTKAQNTRITDRHTIGWFTNFGT
jgi:hypothetical protein